MTSSRDLSSTATSFPVVALIAMSALALACADASTKPREASLVTAKSRSAVMATSEVASPLIDDASGRLAGVVDDAVARDQLRSLLAGLSSALDKGNERSAREQLARLRKFIAARTESSEAADLAAIELALDQIESQLSSATPPDK